MQQKNPVAVGGQQRGLDGMATGLKFRQRKKPPREVVNPRRPPNTAITMVNIGTREGPASPKENGPQPRGRTAGRMHRVDRDPTCFPTRATPR